MAALSRARGHTMRDIVATIQTEQDEAIRAPHQGFTMISGGPGTGKTVVALHRAAYLLYSNRRRFESGGVLVVGPSRVFMNYIERVLPSLGEESVTLRSVGSVASDVVPVRGDRADPGRWPRSRQLADVRVLRDWSPSRRKRSDGAAGDVQGHVLVLREAVLDQIRLDVLAHYKLNQGRERPRRPCSTRCGASRRKSSTSSGRSSTSGSATPPHSSCSSMRGGRPSPRPGRWAGSPI